MKVAFLLPDLAMGGAQRHTLDLARRLTARGHTCVLAVFKHRVSDDLAREFADLDVTFLHGGRMTSLAHWTRTVRWLADADADVVFCVNQTPTILGAGARMLGALRGRLYSVFHTTVLLETDRSRFPAFRAAARLSDGVVFVSRNQLAYWTARGLKAPTTRAIVNGVDLQRFQPAAAEVRERRRAALSVSPDTFVIALSANFRPEKNHAQLLDAVRILRARGMDATALMIGDGATRKEAEAAARRLGIFDACRFVGEQADVRPFVAASDAGVLCSTSVETLSLAALEIAAMGKPLVLSDIGGASEIVAEGVNGHLFPVGDTDALVGALERTRSDQARLGAQARTRMEARFDVHGMVDGYEALIRAPARP